jgi:hypothetical protein
VSLSAATRPGAGVVVPTAALLGSVFVLGLTLGWTFLSMRTVMDVGGACADGGPYVSAQPCPDGSWVIGLAIPVMLLSAFLGSFAAARLSAPNLLIPMWLVLFGSLGWNFLKYGLGEPGNAGFVVCGVVFELMALPALVVIGIGLRACLRTADGARSPVLTWALAYPLVGAAGALVGVVTFHTMA